MLGGDSQADEKYEDWIELYEGNVEDLPTGYEEVNCYIIFNVNMVKNNLFIYNGWRRGKTTIKSSLNYFSVLYWEIEKISLTIDELDYLKVNACNINNKNLTVKFLEKIWTVTRTDFGS